MRHLRILLVTLLTIVGATIGMAQNLYICGNPITTSGTISGISGVSGSLTYSGTTLTLNNATIAAGASQGITMNQGTIVVQGDNTISSSDYNALKIGGSVTIRGTGTLTLIGNGTGNGGSTAIGGCGIYFENTNINIASLSIMGGVLLKSQGARYGVYGDNSNQILRFSGENTSFITQGTISSIYFAGNLQLSSPLQILTPEGASFNSSEKVVVDASGNVVNSEVIIAKEGYGTQDNPEAYAVLSGSRLAFYYDGNRDMHVGTTKPITGNVPDWVNNTAITTVDFDASYDNYRPTTAQSLFKGLTNLTTINNISRLHTDNVTNMSRMFFGCSSLTSLDVSGFNTMNVTTMDSMFDDCSLLTSLDLSNFNTAKVTTMHYMFYCCYKLANLDVSCFNTEKVTDMSYMFSHCPKLTSLDVSSFNTTNVTDMHGMFYQCSMLTSLDVSNFNTEKVTTMNTMFSQCSELTSLNLLSFNTEKVTDMGWMFSGCSNLTTIYCDDDWNTSTVTSSSDMFTGCTALVGGNGTVYDANNVGIAYAHPDATGNPGYFTRFQETAPVPYAIVSIDGKKITFYYDGKQTLRQGTKYGMTWDIPGWTDTSLSITITKAVFDPSFDDYHNLTNASYMFCNMRNLEEIVDLRYLHTENVKTMSNMFSGCNKLTTIDVSGFDTHNVTNMSQMFAGCPVSSLDLSNFNTENVTNMNYVFRGCSSLTSLDLRNFDTKKVTDMSYMFSDCSNLETIFCNDNWKTTTVQGSTNMFKNCTKLNSPAMQQYDDNKVDVEYANPDTGYFTTKSVAYAVVDNTTLTFYYDTQKNSRTGTKYDMTWDIFPGWTKTSGNNTITTVKFDSSFYNYHEMTKTSYMFFQMTALTQINGLNYLRTENVTEMSSMFDGCSKLTSLDLRKFNTGNVTYMNRMFFGCSKLTGLDLSKFNTEKVTNMSTMFYNCSALISLDLSNFNTENVTDMMSLFFGCSSLTSLDLMNFNTKNVTDMSFMFYGCENLESIYCNDDWNTTTEAYSNDMFTNCTRLVGGNGTTYDANNVTIAYAHPDAAGNPGYFNDKVPYAVVSEDGKTLTFYYDAQRNSRTGTKYPMTWNDYPGWTKSSGNNTITTVTFDASFANYHGLTSTKSMFYNLNSTAFTQIEHLEYLNTENVTNMESMFYRCIYLTNLDLTSFNTAKVTEMSTMFYGCGLLRTIYCNDDWNTSTLNYSYRMFYGCNELVGGNGTAYNSSSTGAEYAHPDEADNPGYFTMLETAYAVLSTDGKTLTFYYDGKQALRPGTKYSMTWDNYPGWTESSVSTAITKAVFDPSFDNYHNLTNASYMFYNMQNLTEIVDLRYLHTENVLTMSNMFSTSNKLTTFDVSGFDTHNVTDMSQMFAGCPVSSLDLSNFNTENVTNMYHMFRYCAKITTVDLTNFNTANVENMSGMFGYCSSLTSLDLRNFDIKKVTNMSYMFSGCSNLVTIYCNDNWDTSTVTESGYMFGDCYKLTGGNGTTCNPNIAHSRPVAYAHPDGGISNPGYFTWKAVLGDVNQDGHVDVADVTAAVNIVKGNSSASYDSTAADLNGDGEVTQADVKLLVKRVLGIAPHDEALTYKVNIVLSQNYNGVSIPIDEKICKAFNLSAQQIADQTLDTYKEALDLGEIAFYACKSDGTPQAEANTYTTNPELGYFMDKQGNTSNYGKPEANVVIEFVRSSQLFNVLQYPDRNAAGDTGTYHVALRYKADDGNTYTAKVTFNVTFVSSGSNSYTLQ